MNVVTTMLAAILAAFILGLLLSIPVMLLWNWLMPVIFGLPEVGWLQSFGLMLLYGFLFNTTARTGD